MNLSLSRRSLVAGGALAAASFALGGAATALDGGQALLRPPGAQDEERFRALCLKCDRCRSVCPQGCIRTGVLEDGLLNWRTPVMDFRRGLCDFCGRCEERVPHRRRLGRRCGHKPHRNSRYRRGPLHRLDSGQLPRMR